MSSDRPLAALSREDFARNLGDSGLFPEDELRAILAPFLVNPEATDGATLAWELVSAGKLTAYQARAVLEGRLTDLRIGNYEVLDLLGSGGMGTVFKARHRRMKRVVALKLLDPNIAKTAHFVQRFQREVETIAQLNHPNIVMAYDADEAEVGHFLVMELVNGCDLASEVQSTGPLSMADAVHAVLQAGHGLAYAHERNIVHRDVKPANLLRDASGAIKVADLGLARLSSGSASTSLTQVGGIIGTPDFMAPEQALDPAHTDFRGDVYSLGCTLFFLLTGRTPYVDSSVLGLLLQHREAPLPDLCAARPGVTPALNQVFQRMIAKKPEDRFASMAEAVAALEVVKIVAAPAIAPRRAAAPDASQATWAADSKGELLTLPGRKAAHRAEAASTPVPSPLQRAKDLTVVVVEPSRAQAGIIRKYLQQLGITNVHTTGTGQQAIEIARKTGATALFSAMHLPDMTGLEMEEAFHALPQCADIGIVLATSGSEADETGSLIRDRKRTALLPKPFDLKRLALALAEATRRPAADLLAKVPQ
jgi:CheY-like chemotaxis protein/tRNA A-37 threonylcarbamoyl transferase component Bud32